MDRQNIFLSDEKTQDLEGYLNDSKDELRPLTHISSVASEPAESASSVRTFVKWALLCTLIVLAMTFTSELYENHGSKASPSTTKTVLVAC